MQYENEMVKIVSGQLRNFDLNSVSEFNMHKKLTKIKRYFCRSYYQMHRKSSIFSHTQLVCERIRAQWEKAQCTRIHTHGERNILK